MRGIEGREFPWYSINGIARPTELWPLGSAFRKDRSAGVI